MPVSHKLDCRAAIKSKNCIWSLKHWASFKKKPKTNTFSDFQYSNGKISPRIILSLLPNVELLKHMRRGAELKANTSCNRLCVRLLKE